MYRNSKTGDPNQQSRSSVFSFDSYPSRSSSSYESRTLNQDSNLASIQHATSFPQRFMARPTTSSDQFPFNISIHEYPNRGAMPVRKRKTTSPPLQLRKQHITEEKMSEHMSKLHISSETVTSSKETDNARAKRLYMCEEMRKLQSDPIVPQCLLTRVQKPCTAVVVWRPLPRVAPVLGDIDENENNETDNNTMEMNCGVEMSNDSNTMEMDR